VSNDENTDSSPPPFSLSETKSAHGETDSDSLDRPGASARTARRFLDDPDYILRTWAAILLVAAIDCIWVTLAGIRISGIAPLIQGATIITAVGFFFDYTARTKQVSDLAYYLAMWLSFAVALDIYSYLVATIGLPLWDLRFARADIALGFNWIAGFDLITSHRTILHLLVLDYSSIFIQVLASIAYFAAIRRSDRNRELLWLGMLSAFITASLSGLFPALGPYTKGGMPAWSAVLLTLRDGSLTTFVISKMTGIVAFPSFHTALAIVVVYVHRPPLRSFVPMAAVNALMLPAIPFSGHHYLVDMIAGSAVAAISILIVRTMQARSLAETQDVRTTERTEVRSCP